MALVGHWKLDGDATDSSGNGNDGNVDSGITWEEGITGQCAVFDGSNNIVIPHSSDFNITEQISIFLWVYMNRMPADMASRYPAVFNKSNDTYRYGVYQSDTSQMGLRMNYDSSDRFEDDYLIQSSPNHWVPFAVTYDGQTMRFYENKELVHTAEGSITINTDTSDIVIGGGWEGKLEDVRFYDHALSDRDIEFLSQPRYLSTKEQEYIDSQAVLHYGFDYADYVKNSLVLDLDATKEASYPGSGSTWYDLSGNSYNAVADPDSNTFPTWQSDDGGRFYFDGSSGLEIPDNMGDYDSATHEIMLWRTDTSTSSNYISDARNGTGSWWLTNYNSHNINIQNTLEVNDPPSYTGDSNFWGKWILVTLVETGSGSKCYIDGKQITDDRLISSGSLNVNLGSNFRIANRYTGSGRWKGYMSSYRIYNRALTDNEILHNYYYKLYTTNSIIGRGAYEFDGVDDFIETQLQWDKDDFTYAAWVKFNSILSSGWMDIIDCYEGTSSEWARLATYNGNWIFVVDRNQVRVDAVGSAPVINTWYHVAGTRSGSEMKLYVNGELNATATHSETGTILGLEPECIGAQSLNKTENFDGKITDVRIYATALTQAQITTLYQTRASIDDKGNFWGIYFNELGYRGVNILNYLDWTVGTSGSQGNFSQNGSTSENEVVELADPWGKLVPVWKCIPDSDNHADGGWNNNFDDDNSYSYRSTVFIKRTGGTNGSTYHGCDNDGNTLNLDGTSNGNPYFWNGNLPSHDDTWYLSVGIIHSNNYTGGDTGVAGVYSLDGTKQIDGTEFKYGSGTRQEQRVYLYYCTNTSNRQYMVYPRIDKLDGTEPSLDELLSGYDSYTYEERERYNNGLPTQPLQINSNGVLDINLISETGSMGGIVGYWPLNGDAKDYSGEGNDGTVNGAVSASGLNQLAYEFDGNDDYIDCGNSVWTNHHTQSVSIWFNRFSDQTESTNHNVHNMLLAKASTGYNDNFELGTYGSDIELYFDTTGDNETRNFSSNVSNNIWHFIVITFNYGLAHIYLDGSLVNSSDWGGTLDTSADSSPFAIGESQHEGAPFNGKIQEVRIYDRALTAEEVQILYDLGTGKERVKMSNNTLYTKSELIED